MNLEQRARNYDSIVKVEILLAYAEKAGLKKSIAEVDAVIKGLVNAE